MGAATYLCGKALDKDGYEQVEEHVVSERHERNEVEGRPRGRLGHPVIQHLVPVLLGQDLQEWGKDNNSCILWWCESTLWVFVIFWSACISMKFAVIWISKSLKEMMTNNTKLFLHSIKGYTCTLICCESFLNTLLSCSNVFI